MPRPAGPVLTIPIPKRLIIDRKDISRGLLRGLYLQYDDDWYQEHRSQNELHRDRVHGKDRHRSSGTYGAQRVEFRPARHAPCLVPLPDGRAERLVRKDPVVELL